MHEHLRLLERRVEHAALVAQKIVATVSEPYDVLGQELFVSCSVGVALYPCDGDHGEVLMKHADAAMYRAKERGRNNWQLYEKQVPAQRIARLDLETALRRAIERDELSLHYQPQIDLAHNSVCGAEALRVDGTRPEKKAGKPARTHWDMLLERRSIKELEVLLAERLELLRADVPVKTGGRQKKSA